MTKEDDFESPKILEKRFLVEILYYQDANATNKINGSSALYSSTNVFQIEFLIEEFEHVVAEQNKFENGEI